MDQEEDGLGPLYRTEEELAMIRRTWKRDLFLVLLFCVAFFTVAYCSDTYFPYAPYEARESE